MSKIALSGDASGTGTFTIASPNSNSNYTLNLPTATGTINTSGAVNEVPAGSASAPSIYPTGDTNTGIFFPAADTIAFTEGGTEAMRIDSSGNLGLGVTPSAFSGVKALQLPPDGMFGTQGVGGTYLLNNAYYNSGFKYSATGVASYYAMGSGAHAWYYAASGTAGNAITFTQAMTLDASGNLGIGNTSPQTALGFASGGSISWGTSNYPYISGDNSSNFIAFGTQATERARITSGGEFCIGTSSTIGVGATLNVLSGGNVLHIKSTSSSANNILSYDSGGTVRFSVSNGGAVTKASGSFKIDHPIPEKKDTHFLVHSFVEAPQADNIYRGKATLVDGMATVNLDINSGMTEGTFELLNREVQCFTTNETGWVAVRGFVVGNVLTIEAQDATCIDTISWLVIGERKDKHMYDTDWTDDDGKVIVEPIKGKAV